MSAWSVSLANPWPLDRVVRLLGSAHVEWIKLQPNAVAVCKSRAAGAWMANEAETYAAYTSLRVYLRAEEA